MEAGEIMEAFTLKDHFVGNGFAIPAFDLWNVG
jgi:hypothetical protein